MSTLAFGIILLHKYNNYNWFYHTFEKIVGKQVDVLPSKISY